MKLSMPEMPPALLLAALGSYNLLPAIVFLPTRRRCDEAASEAALSRRAVAGERREARRGFMRSTVSQNPANRAHRQLDTIIRRGDSAPHARHKPPREIAEQSFAHRNLLPRIHELQSLRDENETHIVEALEHARIKVPASAVRGLERLASARARLLELAPQTRWEAFVKWLREVVQPGRVVAIGRSGRRLVLVTARSHDGVTGVREDGRLASFPIERIGRGFAPIFSIQPDRIDEAFDEIHERGGQLAVPEPRLRDAQTSEADSIKLINDLIDSLLPSELSEADRAAGSKALWSLQTEAVAIERAERQIERMRE